MADDSPEQPDESAAQLGPRARRSRIVAEHLLEAAAGVFGEKGYEKARVSDVARACGMSTGTVFSRWPTKDDLFCAAVEFVSPKQSVREIAERDVSASEKIAALGECLVSTDRARYRDLMLEARTIARRRPELRSRLAEAFQAEIEAYEAIMAAGQETGLVDATLETGPLAALGVALELGMHLAASTDPQGDTQPLSAGWGDLLQRGFVALRAPRSSD